LPVDVLGADSLSASVPLLAVAMAAVLRRAIVRGSIGGVRAAAASLAGF
jgi:hypothetical protein